MKRENLIWLAAGSAASCLTFVVAGAIAPSRSEQIPMLALEEQFDRLVSLDDEQFRETGPLNGKLLYDCGARAFEMDAVVPDAGGQARIALTSENKAAVDCILKAGAEQGFEMSLTFRPMLATQPG